MLKFYPFFFLCAIGSAAGLGQVIPPTMKANILDATCDGTFIGSMQCSAGSPCSGNTGFYQTPSDYIEFYTLCDLCSATGNITLRAFSDSECKNQLQLFYKNVTQQNIYMGTCYAINYPFTNGGIYAFTPQCITGTNDSSSGLHFSSLFVLLAFLISSLCIIISH